MPLSAVVAAPAPLLTELAEAVDAVQEHGPFTGGRTDTSMLLRLAERLRGLALRELAEMDTTGGHLVAGQHPTTASWLREHQLLTEGAARSAVRLAVELRDVLPQLAALLQAGTVSVEHAAAVLGGVRGLDPQLVTEASDGLCALARLSDPTAVRRRLRDMAGAVDDRLIADAARRAADRQGLRLSQVGDSTAVDGSLAGDDAATVRLAMELGVEAARAEGDKRGLAARRAGLLVTLCQDYLQRRPGSGDSLAGDAHTVRSHLLVDCTPEQLADPQLQPTATLEPQPDARPGVQPPTGPAAPTLADLLARDAAAQPSYRRGFSASIVGDTSPLCRGALRRLACDATLTLIVRADPAGHACEATRVGRSCPHLAQPLYVGRSARTISGAQFTALVARDRTCVVQGCHRAPAACAGHHVQHWADGGASDLDNLVLLCHQHHHDHHDRGLDLPHRDGVRWLTRTGWAHAPT